MTVVDRTWSSARVTRDPRAASLLALRRFVNNRVPPARDCSRERKSGDDEVARVSGLLRSIRPAGPNLLVIRTAIGAAQRVALALDRCNWPEIVGNVGGDDTVFTATTSATGQRNLVGRIERATARR